MLLIDEHPDLRTSLYYGLGAAVNEIFDDLEKRNSGLGSNGAKTKLLIDEAMDELPPCGGWRQDVYAAFL